MKDNKKLLEGGFFYDAEDWASFSSVRVASLLLNVSYNICRVKYEYSKKKTVSSKLTQEQCIQLTVNNHVL